jgi:hypothetical protein
MCGHAGFIMQSSGYPGDYLIAPPVAEGCIDLFDAIQCNPDDG